MHAYNVGYQEADTGRWQAKDVPGVQGLCANLDYARKYHLKKKTRFRKKQLVTYEHLMPKSSKDAEKCIWIIAANHFPQFFK